MSRPTFGSSIRWSLFALPLVALGVFLWHFFPPEPRRVIETEFWPHEVVRINEVPMLVMFRESQNLPHIGRLIRGPVKLLNLQFGEETGPFWTDAQLEWPALASKDGRFLAARLDKGRVGLIDWVERREWSHQFSEEIANAAISPDGALLLVGCKPHEIMIFETATTKVIERTKGWHGSADFSPSSSHVLFWNDDDKHPLQLWSREQRRVVARFDGGESGNFFPFSPDDGRLLLHEHHPTKDNAWALWDVKNLKRIAVLEPAVPIGGFQAVFASAQFLVTFSNEQPHSALLEFWSAETGKRLGSAVAKGEIANVEFAPDGKTMVVEAHELTDKKVVISSVLAVFDVPSGAKRWERTWVAGRRFSSLTYILPLRVGGAQHMLVGGDSPLNALETVDWMTGKTRHTFSMQVEEAWSWPRLSGDQRVLMLPTVDDKQESAGLWQWFKGLFFPRQRKNWPRYNVTFFEVASGRETCRLDDAGSVNVIPLLTDDGQTLITWDDTPTPRILIWDIPPKKPWRYIVGGPAALGLFVLAWRYWRKWRKRRLPATTQLNTSPTR